MARLLLQYGLEEAMPLIKGNFVYNPETQEFRERSAGDPQDVPARNELPPPAALPELTSVRSTERHTSQPIRPLTHDNTPFRKKFWVVGSVLLIVWLVALLSQLRDSGTSQNQFMTMDEIIIDPDGDKLFDVVPR